MNNVTAKGAKTCDDEDCKRGKRIGVKRLDISNHKQKKLFETRFKTVGTKTKLHYKRAEIQHSHKTNHYTKFSYVITPYQRVPDSPNARRSSEFANSFAFLPVEEK